jgi:murein DD-endopeptidase MepM/ murein hydrolase activator NlpD
MLRRALPTLFCAFALTAPVYSQDVFVPRELKAQPVHPLKEHKPEAKPEKPVEVARKAEAATDGDAKPAKDPAGKKVAKEEKAPAKEKAVAAKAQPPAKELPVIKVEKATAPKESATKTVAKAEPAKDVKEKAAASKKDPDVDLPTIKVEKTVAAKDPAPSKTVAKNDSPATKQEKAPAKDDPEHKKAVAKTESVKVETAPAKSEKPATKDHAATVAASKTLKLEKNAKEESPAPKTESAKPEVTVAKTEKPAPAKDKEKPVAKIPPAKTEAMIAKVEPEPPREGPAKVLPSKADIVSVPSQKDPAQLIPAMNSSLDTGFTKIADGFDFPVGKPEAEGYYKARGFRPGGHVGEDWDGVRGGDTDLRDPIYSVGDGIVVFAHDVHLGWGNVIIVRHAYREGGTVKYVDALYGHLNTMLVGRGQRVARGQQIATMGTAHGQYDAHLHFEIRKNLEIGMSRSKFQKDFSNYYDPTQFINAHRHLSGGGANYKVAMNTFTHDGAYHFDKNRDFGSRKRSTAESSAALRRSLTSNR